MITVEQIKAARALLGWSQKDLAIKAGYALPTLNNLERGLNTPRPQTLSDIKQAFEKNGIQFIDRSGVRLLKEILDIKMYEGPECLRHLYMDILRSLPETKSEVLLSNIDERKFLGFDKKTMFEYVKALDGKTHVSHKLLFRHGDTYMLSPEKLKDMEGAENLEFQINSQWRWLPKNLFGLAPMIIYANKYATILWDDPARVVITENKSITDTFRKQFMAIWNIAEEIPEAFLPYALTE